MDASARLSTRKIDISSYHEQNLQLLRLVTILVFPGKLVILGVHCTSRKPRQRMDGYFRIHLPYLMALTLILLMLTLRALGCLWASLYKSSEARWVLLKTRSKDGPISSSSILGVLQPDIFSKHLQVHIRGGGKKR